MSTHFVITDLVIRPSIVLLTAGVLTLLLRHRSAASRHLVWSAAVCSVLLIPFLGATIPALDVPVGDSLGGMVRDWPVVSEFITTSADISPGVTSTIGDPTGGESGGIPWGALWLVGATISLGELFARYVGLRRIERSAVSASGSPVARRLEDARRRLGVDRPIELMIGDPDAMPMTWGLRVPRILLPAGALEWPEAQTDAVLLHELAHVKRGDVPLQRCAEVARAVFWFNPLAWLAARRMQTEREHACDDAVLRTGVRGSEYAHQLLAMAHSLRSARGTACALQMARRSQMTGRLLAILDEGRARWSPRGATPPLALGCAALLALAVTSVQPVVATNTRSASATETGDLPAAELQVAPGEQGDPRDRLTSAGSDTVGCWHPIGPDSNHNKNEDPGVITASWSTSRCIGGLRITGRAVLLADTSGFAALGPGGQVSIGEKEGDYWRRIELTGRPDGQPELAGRFGDERASYDQLDGWLRANLRPMLRLTGVELEVAGGP